MKNLEKMNEKLAVPIQRGRRGTKVFDHQNSIDETSSSSLSSEKDEDEIQEKNKNDNILLRQNRKGRQSTYPSNTVP